MEHGTTFLEVPFLIKCTHGAFHLLHSWNGRLFLEVENNQRICYNIHVYNIRSKNRSLHKRTKDFACYIFYRLCQCRREQCGGWVCYLAIGRVKKIP